MVGWVWEWEWCGEERGGVVGEWRKGGGNGGEGGEEAVRGNEMEGKDGEEQQLCSLVGRGRGKMKGEEEGLGDGR